MLNVERRHAGRPFVRSISEYCTTILTTSLNIPVTTTTAAQPTAAQRKEPPDALSDVLLSQATTA